MADPFFANGSYHDVAVVQSFPGDIFYEAAYEE
jgi:hypothetical protein